MSISYAAIQAIYQLSALRIPPHFIETNCFRCHHHPIHYIANPQATILKPFAVPTDIIELPSLELFSNLM